MTIKYRELMTEYKVTLENEDKVLDKAFVSKALDFEEKLKNNQLTDEEITALDNELVELFNTLHDFVEEDSDEIKAANHKALLNEAKAAIAECGTIEDLAILREKYNELSEIEEIVEQKKEKIIKQGQQAASLKREKLIDNAKKEIAAAKYEELQALGEKYKEYPELITIIKKRHNDEKPGNEEAKLKETLLSKKEWSYADLRALGINPTGNDMTVAGVRLDKEYLLTIYRVRK